MRNALYAIFDRFSLVKRRSTGNAGGGARTHTILRSLDFESSASASSATPAAGKKVRAGKYEFTKALQGRCGGARRGERRCWMQRHVACGWDSRHYTNSSGCKLRGGPKISRRIMAFRKSDADLSSVAI